MHVCHEYAITATAKILIKGYETKQNKTRQNKMA